MLFYESSRFLFFDTATTVIYTLSLHDALPICGWSSKEVFCTGARSSASTSSSVTSICCRECSCIHVPFRSEEHTSELQSLTNLVCRLLLEKKNASRDSQSQSIRAIGQTHRPYT